VLSGEHPVLEHGERGVGFGRDFAGRSATSAADVWRAWPSAARARSRSDAALTRAFDICVALAMLLVAMPVLVLIALAIKLDDRGPVLFRQLRIGKGGKLFTCLKFRTMCVDADRALSRHLAECSRCRAEWQHDHKLRNDPRVTRLGRMLRKYSLDEFPQLINILRGEMSITGPRPIVASEIERYGRHFGAYCAVKPGLTGLWQVSGRNDVSYRRRVAIDRYYAMNRTLMLDMKIVAMTVPAVVLAKGY